MLFPQQLFVGYVIYMHSPPCKPRHAHTVRASHREGVRVGHVLAANPLAAARRQRARARHPKLGPARVSRAWRSVPTPAIESCNLQIFACTVWCFVMLVREARAWRSVGRPVGAGVVTRHPMGTGRRCGCLVHVDVRRAHTLTAHPAAVGGTQSGRHGVEGWRRRRRRRRRRLPTANQGDLHAVDEVGFVLQIFIQLPVDPEPEGVLVVRHALRDHHEASAPP
jgi:hypothetical protein